MRYDDLYDYIGHMGRYQWTVFAVMFACCFFSMDYINMVFVGAEMEHWCRVEQLSGLTHEQQKYIAIPVDKTSDNGDKDEVVKYNSCEMFDVNWTVYSANELANWNRTQWMKGNKNSTVMTRTCTEWNYDDVTFTSTIVSKV